MFAARALRTVMTPGLVLLLAGCGSSFQTFGGSAKSATEERSLTAPHVPRSGLDVHTPVGAVEVVADPAAKEVQITAKVTAAGDTEEEARARLKDIQVKLTRRDDRVLEVRVEQKDAQGLRGGCSFVIRVPEADGVKVRTGNGAVSLKGLGGAADVHTSVGPVTVADHRGGVTAHTGNGAVRVSGAAGDVEVVTSVGPVTVQGAGGAVKATTGNGALAVTKAAAAVEARTSVGPVTVRDAAGDVTATTGNGSVTVTGAKGAVTARSSVGPVKLEQVSGKAEAHTDNGAVTYAAAAGSNSSFSLKTGVGPITIRLPASVGGRVRARTSVGNVTVNGPRQPRSVTGERGSKEIVLTEKGPESSAHAGNGGITITLE